MQKPNFFRVTIPVENPLFVERIREFVEELRGSEVALNFGEQRNKKEFKYLIEKSTLDHFYIPSTGGECDYLRLVFRQVKNN
jgi:hypothetical protein